MKKISLIILAGLLFITGVNAQNVDDALRYSQIFYGGTARFMSMGGAFTALGGDLSSLSQNPAGLGVFRSSELTITPQLFHVKSSAGFNGITSDYLYNFNLNQVGIVSSIISNTNETGLITLNFGYSFNKTNNLNQSIRIQGTSNTSSMADYWSGISEGTLYKDLKGPEGIAYDAWVIDTITGSGGRSYGTVFSNYGDNPPPVYGQTIRRLVSYEGYTGEHALSIGGNYSNKIFFGATLGISKLKYTSHFEHLESTDIGMASQFKNFTYTDHYENTGTGYSLKLGAIIKPIETLRIGLAFHSPTLYRINEYFYEDITSNFTDGSHYESSETPQRYNYALTTPFRALAGVALQIKKFALLSADYEFVDYSTAKFSETGDGYDYTEKNQNIKNSLKSASNIRLGGEFRIDKLYLRTGYGYYGKAFQTGEDNQNLNYSSISFGAGFREQNIFIDFAYTNYSSSQVYSLYPVNTGVDAANANISTNQNMFTVTLGYKFGY
ncbi:MAG: hypothetical protein EPN88_05510 [Bacteroidetes bacterium]|nr:MAG: hypothetical protein EPN88_05510 [Bacteroidota bacterium]